MRKNAKYDLNTNYFNDDNAEVYYIAGIIAADGCVMKYPKKKNVGVLSIGLKESDIKLLELIKEKLKYSGPITKKICKDSLRNKNHKDSIQYVLRICSVTLCKSLERFGINERKSQTYKIPETIVNSKYINNFLLGYFDGDGSILVASPKLKPHGMIHIRGSLECLSQINDILIKNNIVENKIKSIKNDSGIGSLQYNGTPISIKIYEYLANKSSIKLERKYLKYLDVKKLSKD